MIIKRFKGVKLNGYINSEFEFFDDLTFLYGINGSGKTTIVKLINAILSLSLVDLCETDFSRVEIDILDDASGELKKIIATQNEQEVLIVHSDVKQVLKIKKYVPDEAIPESRLRGNLEEWYYSQVNFLRGNKVFISIRENRFPVYLGLERKVYDERLSIKNLRFRMAYNKSHMNLGLHDASKLASQKYAEAYSSETELTDELRNALVRVSFKFQDALNINNLKFQNKDVRERWDLERKHKNIKDALKNLKIDGITGYIDQFFTELKDILSNLPTLQSGEEMTADQAGKFLKYEFNKQQFVRANEIAEIVDKYANSLKEKYQQIREYESKINEFLCDSGKEIKVSSDGIIVRIKGDDSIDIDIDKLSSGEKQLISILTQIWFNEKIAESNVFIIDEPELSLHLFWQEKFVDALLSAKPNIQLILATHSPSIINGRDDNAVELIPNYA